jgi:glycosyltransferase involved in cell wall biosynthesis
VANQVTVPAVRPSAEPTGQVDALSPRLRTLLVNPFGDLGGAEIYLLRLLDVTDRLDVEAVLLRDGPLRAELERRGIPVDVLEVGRTGAAIARAIPRMRRLMRDRRPEVVLANGIKAQAVVGPAAALTGHPVLWIKHDHSYDRWLTPALARVSDRVVATAEDVAAASARADVVLIPPARPETPLPRDDARAVLTTRGMSFEADRSRLVMLTRLTPYKGVDTAIRALAAAPSWELVVLGGADPAEPEEGARLEDLARRCGVSDRLRLLGHVPEAARLLSAFDALAVLTRDGGPRTPGREGFGMAAMEAMVAGVPVIAPDDDGAVARRTAASGSGILVDATDPDSVARALTDLGDDGLRQQLAAAASAGAGQFDSLPRSADRLVDLLCEVACRPGAGVARRPAVSVVSPVLDEVAVLDRLVPPVLAQLDDADEFVLVDSGSVDGTRERLRRWQETDPRVRLLEVPRCSIGASRNHGVAAAKNDLVLCTDAGCQVGPDWVSRMRAALAAPDAPDLVVGTYQVAVRPGRRFEVAMAAVAWPDPCEVSGAGLLVRVWTCTLGPRFSARRVDGRSVGFRREAFERAGGFPTGLATAEDEAFGRAVRQAGGRAVLLADATVTWWQRNSVRDAFRQFRGYGRGGGASRSRLLLHNDLVRAGGYLLLVGAFAAGGRRARVAAGAASAAFFAVPAQRVLRRRQSWSAVALLPVAQLVKDGGKLAGVAEALVLGRTGALRRPR